MPFREKRTILQREIHRALVEGLNQKKKEPNEQSIPSTRRREVVELQLYKDHVNTTKPRWKQSNIS